MQVNIIRLFKHIYHIFYKMSKNRKYLYSFMNIILTNTSQYTIIALLYKGESKNEPNHYT